MKEQKTMTQILASQRVIAFNPLFADVADDVIAGLMLSQLCYWSERTNRQDGWFYKSRDEWFIEARLTRKNVETARKKLEKIGVISYQLMGVPAIGHYRVNYLILEAKIKEVYYKNTNKNNRLPESCQLDEDKKNSIKSTDSPNRANKMARNEPTRWHETSQQDGTKRANKMARNEPTITESTQKSNSKNKTNTSYSAEKEADLALSKEEQELLAARAAAKAVAGEEVRSKEGFDKAMKNLGLKKRVNAQNEAIASV